MTAPKRDEFAEPNFELDAMFAEVSAAASLIGQMHWTLLRFGRPEVVSCDHPITPVLWTARTEQAVGAPDVLLLGSFEVRVPIGPRAALLLTWLDADDRVEAVPAAPHHLGVLNRGSWEQAERHRFWQPGARPRGIDDRRSAAPIATELFRGYNPQRSSARLTEALEWSKRRQHSQLASGKEDRAVVLTWMEPSETGLRIVHERREGAHADVFSDFSL